MIYISFIIAHNSSYPANQAISYDDSTRLDDSGVKSQVAKLISSLSHACPDTADHTSLHLGALGSIAVYSRYVITKRARWRPSAACRPSPPRSALSSRRGGQRRRVRARASGLRQRRAPLFPHQLAVSSAPPTTSPRARPTIHIHQPRHGPCTASDPPVASSPSPLPPRAPTALSAPSLRAA